MVDTSSADYQAGYAKGLADGANNGNIDGYNDGFNGKPQNLQDTGTGDNSDYAAGYAAGYKAAYDKAYATAYAKGQTDGHITSTSGTGSTLVTSDQLHQFAANLRFIAAAVDRERQQLTGVQVAAGNFYHGNLLSDTTNGWGSVAGRAAQFYTDLSHLVLASNDLADALDAAAGQYTTTEDLNTALGKEIADWISQFNSELNLTPTSSSSG